MVENTLITGKRGEYRVIGKLLEKGFTVYTPVCDVEEIDCIIRNDKGRLIEIQIKTRNKNEEEGRQFRVKELKPHSDFFIACYLIDTNDLWIIPSVVFQRLSIINKEGVCVLPMSIPTQREVAKYKDNLGLELLKYGSYNNN